MWVMQSNMSRVSRESLVTWRVFLIEQLKSRNAWSWFIQKIDNTKFIGTSLNLGHILRDILQQKRWCNCSVGQEDLHSQAQAQTTQYKYVKWKLESNYQGLHKNHPKCHEMWPSIWELKFKFILDWIWICAIFKDSETTTRHDFKQNLISLNCLFLNGN